MGVVVFRAVHQNRQTKQKRRTIELGNDNINLLVWCVSSSEDVSAKEINLKQEQQQQQKKNSVKAN